MKTLTLFLALVIASFASAQTIQIPIGNTVTLTATPDEFWAFVHWEVGVGEDAVIIEGNPYVFVKTDSAEHVKAVFGQTAELNVTTEGSGTVTITHQPPPGGDPEDFLDPNSPGMNR